MNIYIPEFPGMKKGSGNENTSSIWNSSKIISRPNSLRLMRWLTPTWAIGATGTPQNYGRIEVGLGAHKSCHTSEMVQDRTEVSIAD